MHAPTHNKPCRHRASTAIHPFVPSCHDVDDGTRSGASRRWETLRASRIAPELVRNQERKAMPESYGCTVAYVCVSGRSAEVMIRGHGLASHQTEARRRCTGLVGRPCLANAFSSIHDGVKSMLCLWVLRRPPPVCWAPGPVFASQPVLRPSQLSLVGRRPACLSLVPVRARVGERARAAAPSVAPRAAPTYSPTCREEQQANGATRAAP